MVVLSFAVRTISLPIGLADKYSCSYQYRIKKPVAEQSLGFESWFIYQDIGVVEREKAYGLCV